MAATLSQIAYTAGDLHLEAFDFSAGGWANASTTTVARMRLFWCPWLVRGSLLGAITNGTLTLRVDAPLPLVVSAIAHSLPMHSSSSPTTTCTVCQPSILLARSSVNGWRARCRWFARTRTRAKRTFPCDVAVNITAVQTLAERTHHEH